MPADQLSATFAALADPTRRAIVARLAEGDATVTELARPFPVSLPAISRHLKVLERAGLISRNRSAQSRPSSLRAEPLQEATAWLETYRGMWESRMDRVHHATVARIELRDEGGRTRMTLTDGPYTEEGRRGAGTGWETSFDKLEAVLVHSD